jgi:type IV secretion system protein VirB10
MTKSETRGNGTQASVHLVLQGNGRAPENDHGSQNMQSRKEAFLIGVRTRQSDDYLRSTREAALSRYQTKAGWEIPAVLEQARTADLHGELKALATSKVYDTTTSRYLLIPQGSRIVGTYDSHVSYGQDGVQVSWSRVVYLDASSIDLDGILGLDSRGDADLRDKVDRHYRRLIEFSVLTSLLTASFETSQRNSQSALTYPTPSQTASSAVGQELTQTGAQITRPNLNVQPTIKVPTGYKFTVRVNRDILFEAPYQSVETNPLPFRQPGERSRSGMPPQ